MGKAVVAAALTLCAAVTLWGLGSREKEKTDPPVETEKQDLPFFSDRNGAVSAPPRQITEITEFVRVTGVVRLVGNAPFTEPVLSGADGDWYFENADQKRMAELQQRTVTVEGSCYEESLNLAGGGYSFTRRVLRAVRITAVDSAPAGQ